MKLVNDKQLDSALSSTAQAIRTMGATEDAIRWNPDTGFAEAISLIPLGDGDMERISNYLFIDISTQSRWYDIVYYDDFATAISDINNDCIGTNSVDASDNSVVMAFSYGSMSHIALLKDWEITSTIEINKNIDIILNGKTITINNSKGFVFNSEQIIIDGKEENSEIKNTPQGAGICVTLMEINGGKCSIFGGLYTTTTENAGIKDNQTCAIIVSDGASLEIDDCSIKTYDTNGGSTTAIYMNEGGTLTGRNCILLSLSEDGYGFHNTIAGYGDITLSECSITGRSNHVANEAGNDYGSTSRGIQSLSGNLSLYRCFVEGTHSGLVCKGNFYAEGCVLQSYSHGGAYISSSDGNIFLVDSVIQQCPMPAGYIADTIAGTNNAGIYIGGASNVTLYVDKCRFYGKQQPIVLRGSSGEHGHKLYVSNSLINLDYLNYGIRNDNDNYTYFGIGNNFNQTDLRYDRNYETTEEDYGEVIKQLMNPDTPDEPGEPSEPGEINLQEIMITENGEYTPEEGYDGFSSVTVEVPQPEREIVLQEKEATENGEYVADEGYDGLSKVIVNVPQTGGGEGGTDLLDATLNGTLTTIDSNVSKVISYACYGITTLETVNLPNVTSIGSYAFRGCTGITEFNAPNATSLGNYMMYGCSKIKRLVFPKATSAPSTAFYQCTALEYADFPKAKSISSSTFAYCTKLKTLILRYDQAMVSVTTNSFSGISSFSGHIYVPSALIDTYLANSTWKAFTTRFRALEDYTVDGTITGELDSTKVKI